jgi:hypothetical protein
MAGFRVNRRIKVAKGLTINVSKSGVSTSAKVGKVTVNSRRGATVNVAKGVSYNVSAGSSGNRRKGSAAKPVAVVAAAVVAGPRVVRRPFGMPGWGFWTVGIIAALLLGAIPAVGPLFLLGAVAALVVVWLKTPKRNLDGGGSAAPPNTPGGYVRLGGAGDVAVAGEEYYQDTLRWLSSTVQQRDQITAALVPEPTNAHDPNAVRIDVLHEGKRYTVGYLSARIAPAYQTVLLPLAQQGVFGTVAGKLWGVEEKASNLQVYLRLGAPNALLAAQ